MSVYQSLAKLIRRDPGRRGLAQCPALADYGGAEALERAANSLAKNGTSVGIVTGFPILVGGQPTAETDGPPGAVMLASVLLGLDRSVSLITDTVGQPAVVAACDVCSVPRSLLLEMPTPLQVDAALGGATHCGGPDPVSTDWSRKFLAGDFGRRPTHLVAIERPGPTHTEVSLLSPARSGPPPVARFRTALPADLRDRVLNMRGEAITPYTAPTHLLFERAHEREPKVTTIGIGDGGNEIGMGAIPWELLDDALGLPGSGRVACRIATDELIIAGVSNWGGYALAAAVAHAAGRLDVLRPCDVAGERLVIEALICQAGAVDGVTRLREPTVDGLPLEVHLELLAEIRALFHLPP